MSEPWENNGAVRALLGRILDRLDVRPLEQRSRRFTFRLNDKTFPELYLQASPDDADYLWSLLEAMSQSGLLGLEFDTRRHVATAPPRDRSPTMIVPSKAEVRFREIVGRVLIADPWSEAWRQGCA